MPGLLKLLVYKVSMYVYACMSAPRLQVLKRNVADNTDAMTFQSLYMELAMDIRWVWP